VLTSRSKGLSASKERVPVTDKHSQWNGKRLMAVRIPFIKELLVVDPKEAIIGGLMTARKTDRFQTVSTRLQETVDRQVTASGFTS